MSKSNSAGDQITELLKQHPTEGITLEKAAKILKTGKAQVSWAIRNLELTWLVHFFYNDKGRMILRPTAIELIKNRPGRGEYERKKSAEKSA